MFHDVDVQTIDLPGFGGESLVSPEWGIPEYASWAQSKVESLKSKKVILIGHSFGGRIATCIASRNPEWLAQLVLIGAPCLYMPSQKIRLLKRIAKVVKLLGLKNNPLSLNQELTEADKKGMGEIYRRVVSYDQTEELKKIHARTLILRGIDDTYPSDEVCSTMHQLVQSSTYEVLSGVGHNIHLENPTLLYGIVRKFIIL
jgi:pimeloyl-ACP methyl ester carboxylesterase